MEWREFEVVSEGIGFYLIEPKSVVYAAIIGKQVEDKTLYDWEICTDTSEDYVPLGTFTVEDAKSAALEFVMGDIRYELLCLEQKRAGLLQNLENCKEYSDSLGLNERYMYSLDGERFYGNYKTRDEAVEEACKEAELDGCEQVTVALMKPNELSWSTCEEPVIESMYDEIDDDNFEITDDEEKDLAEMIDNTIKTWAIKNNIDTNVYTELSSSIIQMKKNREEHDYE